MKDILHHSIITHTLDNKNIEIEQENEIIPKYLTQSKHLTQDEKDLALLEK